MRNSNSDIYRSWTFTDVISPISVSSPFSSAQILSPFNSTSAAAQKLHANRLSSALYSSTNSTTLNRLSDWSNRAKTIEETTEHNTTSNPPLIIVHRPDEQTIKNSFMSEHGEEKKHLYRSAVIPDSEHYRSLPFTYVPLSESTTTYTSMISTNLIQSNDQTPNGHTRSLRARSATLPITVTHSSSRTNENISITPFHPTTTTNGASSRAVLKPTTIAFHGSTTTPTLSSTNTSTFKPPTIPLRSSSFAAHSRLISPSNRPLSSSIKHSTPSTTLSRSRSANISSSKRTTGSPIGMMNGQSDGTNSNKLYTTKRNPNVKQTYGSCYIHHVLLPTNIN
jgi:hypothetical protein